MSTKRTAVITGATSGIGLAAAEQLAKAGFELVLVVRDRERAAVAARRWPAARFFLADLSVVDEVARAGAEIRAQVDRVDVLINNAGIHAFSQRVTQEGLPVMVAVNHLAPFVLTSALLPQLRASGGRVVQVASDVHRRVKTLALPEALLSTAPFTAAESSLLYAQSKLLGVLFTKALSRRVAGAGVSANSCCPGLNVTGLGRDHRGFAALAWLLRLFGLFSPRRGARIVTRLATDPALAAVSGQHFSADGRVQAETALVADEALQERLWTETMKLPPIVRAGAFR
jgi:NAD(P)-dependent dehydrogenase (short-subunit alcohol dehydrogenase family)